MSTNPTCIGIGVEEDTAVVVHNGQEAEIIGSGTVTVVKGLNIEAFNTKGFSQGKTLSISNLNVDVLASGDRIMIPRLNLQYV